MEILLSPPLAFLLYVPLVALIVLFGRALAGKHTSNATKNSLYGSGEKAVETNSAPGYRPFFLIAFFFAILDLGVLVLGSGGFTLLSGAYLVGLILALCALLLG